MQELHVTSLPNADLAQFIDHTLLAPDATEADIRRVCAEALQYGFRSVCVSSANVGFVAQLLEGSSVLPVAVVGFPHGNASTPAKVREADRAVEDGAREIDVVVNLGWVKDRKTSDLTDELRKLRACMRPVKLIIETWKLGDHEKRYICEIAANVGIAFVKTCSGFQGGEATVEDIRLMREVVGPNMGIKASGGIRTAERARALIKAGATCLGCSAGVGIVTEGAAAENTGY